VYSARSSHCNGQKRISSRDDSKVEAAKVVESALDELSVPGFYGERIVEMKSQDGVITTIKVHSARTYKII